MLMHDNVTACSGKERAGRSGVAMAREGCWEAGGTVYGGGSKGVNKGTEGLWEGGSIRLRVVQCSLNVREGC